MDLWGAGFILLILGIGVPVAYGLYSFVLTSIPWYWRLSIISIASGLLLLLLAALKEKMGSESPEEIY